MTLNEDLLPTIDAIAEYICGEANKHTVRRLRHLIAVHQFPAKKVGGKIQPGRAGSTPTTPSPTSAPPATGASDERARSDPRGQARRLVRPPDRRRSSPPRASRGVGPVFTGSTPSDRRALHHARAAMKRVRRPKTEGRQ